MKTQQCLLSEPWSARGKEHHSLNIGWNSSEVNHIEATCTWMVWFLFSSYDLLVWSFLRVFPVHPSYSSWLHHGYIPPSIHFPLLVSIQMLGQQSQQTCPDLPLHFHHFQLFHGNNVIFLIQPRDSPLLPGYKQSDDTSTSGSFHYGVVAAQVVILSLKWWTYSET